MMIYFVNVSHEDDDYTVILRQDLQGFSWSGVSLPFIGVMVRYFVDFSQPAPWIILLASSQLAFVILTTAVTSDLLASISLRCGPSLVLVPGSSEAALDFEVDEKLFVRLKRLK